MRILKNIKRSFYLKQIINTQHNEVINKMYLREICFLHRYFRCDNAW